MLDLFSHCISNSKSQNKQKNYQTLSKLKVNSGFLNATQASTPINALKVCYATTSSCLLMQTFIRNQGTEDSDERPGCIQQMLTITNNINN